MAATTGRTTEAYWKRRLSPWPLQSIYQRRNENNRLRASIVPAHAQSGAASGASRRENAANNIWAA
jgi:hypothetical protein